MRILRSLLVTALGLVSLVPATRVIAAYQYPPGFYNDFKWRLIGPFRGGRTRAVAGVPSQPNVFYVGAVNGGVWKTDDAGRTWQPIFDGQPTQSIGAIAIAPSDPSLIYVGSGEGLHRADLSIGNGIYRSTDAGRTWIHLGLTDSQQIAELEVDPHDSRRLFAAVLGHPYGPNTERGIYRSLDSGVTWQRILYQDRNTGGSANTPPRRVWAYFARMMPARVGYELRRILDPLCASGGGDLPAVRE